MSQDEQEPTDAELWDEGADEDPPGRLSRSARECLAEARASLVRPDDGRRR